MCLWEQLQLARNSCLLLSSGTFRTCVRANTALSILQNEKGYSQALRSNWIKAYPNEKGSTDALVPVRWVQGALGDVGGDVCTIRMTLSSVKCICICGQRVGAVLLQSFVICFRSLIRQKWNNGKLFWSAAVYWWWIDQVGRFNPCSIHESTQCWASQLALKPFKCTWIRCQQPDGLFCLSYEERLRKLGLFSLEKALGRS